MGDTHKREGIDNPRRVMGLNSTDIETSASNLERHTTHTLRGNLATVEGKLRFVRKKEGIEKGESHGVSRGKRALTPERSNGRDLSGIRREIPPQFHLHPNLHVLTPVGSIRG
jgi:hypothetical protein